MDARHVAEVRDSRGFRGGSDGAEEEGQDEGVGAFDEGGGGGGEGVGAQDVAWHDVYDGEGGVVGGDEAVGCAGFVSFFLSCPGNFGKGGRGRVGEDGDRA